MPPNAIPEVDPTVFGQGPAEWMTITAKLVPTTTAQTKIEEDKLPTTRPDFGDEVDITPAHLTPSTRTILEFYNAIKTNPDYAIQMTDALGKTFNLTAIGRTSLQPILLPAFERPIFTPVAFSAAANVAIATAAADEEFTLSQALAQDKIKNREFWHITLGQPMLTVGDKGVVSTNRVIDRQNWEQGQPITMTSAAAHLILVGDVMMYTNAEPVETATPV